MPMNLEVETREPCEDDDSEDAFLADEDGYLDCHPGVSEACFGNWFSSDD